MSNKKQILIFFYDFEINADSTRSISRLIGSVITELESRYIITYISFSRDYSDKKIQTIPVLVSIKSVRRLFQKIINTIKGRKVIKEFQVRRKAVMNYFSKVPYRYDIIIVPGLDDVNFLRSTFPQSKIIYWIHGISAIYNKEYLKHINKIDFLWSPTITVYKKIINELHPVPLTAEFQLIPNWADECFRERDDDLINEIKAKHSINEQAKVFIFCGGSIRLKGKFLLEKVFRHFVNTSNHEIIVFIAGEPVKNDEIISADIRFVYPGLLEPAVLAAYYHASTFGLFPSLGGYEHAPLTLIEMIACNVLPVASDVGGIKEMLGFNYPLLVDAPHHIEEWSDKIEMVLQMDKGRKNELLGYLKGRMENYKRKDFVRLLSEIEIENDHC